ncbi:dTDP-4-dehydrorhamnose 3,5-epimerase [Crenobacter cavernae]|uniref:dTDP-4-dehydrorhamnose 3,5-epimerase n=1 Tax=Crenobacter cavernae TaxID=2290923 RepID=A0A345Y287_9NEIS|nr:dTDP-4-dehydrorhamnose 3,5-epimerase [Crenobacter cavernae]AXK38039.1 dTDP-4-dehydrorhamnose 3,5-epimerase [Crenobacter cavernae]
MQVNETGLEGPLLLSPAVHRDERGFFLESYNARAFNEAVGREVVFVQDNHLASTKGVLRGLHYQHPRPQGKLVRVTAGEMWDVVVDLRRTSPTFGRWFGTVLSAENRLQLWIPEGFAHGFLTLTDSAEVQYKTTDYWVHDAERCIAWNDADIGIDWPLAGGPILSDRDHSGSTLRDAVLFA